MSQSNVIQGDKNFLAGEDLTDKEEFLVVLTHDGGVAEVLLPALNDAQALYLLIDGGADTVSVSVRPLEGGRNYRTTLNGTCNPGDIVVLADGAGTAADKGKIRVLPSVAGTYRGLGWFEEVGTDEQEALWRAFPQGNITVS